MGEGRAGRQHDAADRERARGTGQEQYIELDDGTKVTIRKVLQDMQRQRGLLGDVDGREKSLEAREHELEAMEEMLAKEKDIRAVMGVHSKRVAAYTAAAMEPDRVVGVVYMGNESVRGRSDGASPFRALEPPYIQKWVKADVLYIGGTNEDGYEMFGINRMQERMEGKWTIAMVPNYRHASMSEKHFLDWQMWVAH